MMIKIRKGMFETNSSSSHSFTIESEGPLSSTIAITGGVCIIYPGEFGWEIDEFNDAAIKASYCLTFAKQKEYKSSKYLDMLREVISEHMGGVEVEFNSEHMGGVEVEFRSFKDEVWPWGYIDHQSLDQVEEIFSSKDNLRNFIFNPNSVLRTDNDNHD